MRAISAATATLSGTLLLVSSCGSSKSAAPITNRVAAPSRGAVTKTQASGYARAVNLKAGDVPDLTPIGAERETPPKKTAEESARCSGAPSRSGRVADINSPKFSGATASPRELIGSEVMVWPSAVTAERNAAAETGPRGRACAQHLLERVALRTLTSRVHLAHVSVTWLPAPLQGASSYAARVTMAFAAEGPRAQTGPSSAVLESPATRAHKVQVLAYLDVQGFQSGPAQVVLTALGVKRPAARTRERRLLTLLYTRARAIKL
jgi:hypothetical protein